MIVGKPTLEVIDPPLPYEFKGLHIHEFSDGTMGYTTHYTIYNIEHSDYDFKIKCGWDICNTMCDWLKTEPCDFHDYKEPDWYEGFCLKGEKMEAVDVFLFIKKR